jgi:predicted O-methyltransferase YrrM
MLGTVPSDRPAVKIIQGVRRRLAEDCSEHERSDGDFERISLPEEECNVLRDVLIFESSRVVVEIGLAYGSSALAIGEALASQEHQEPKHVIIDAYQHHFGDAGWHALGAARLTNVSTLLRERSQFALARLAAEGFTADAAFVDGSHIFHNVFVDLYFLREVVRPGGLLVLDDCEWPSVATAVRYFQINSAWHPEAIAQQTRLRAFRLPDPRVEPSHEEFKPFGDALPG